MLKERVRALGAPIEIWSLKTTLPCCHLVSSDRTCMKEAQFAVVYRRNDNYIVFPYCDKHLTEFERQQTKTYYNT